MMTGCGGDAESGPTGPTAPPLNPSPTCTNAAQPFSVVADASVAVGRTAGAVVAGCSGALSNVSWQQTGGPAVTLLSARTQAISFDPPSTGTYTFNVSFVDAAGSARTATATINVNATTAV
jgi:hypothetical protein